MLDHVHDQIQPPVFTSRRAFLTAAAATTLACGPAVAQTKATDPHPEWVEKWRKVRDEWCQLHSDQAQDDALWAEKERLGDLICETKAHTVEGVRAQIAWVIEDSYLDLPYAGHGDALRLAMASLTALS